MKIIREIDGVTHTFYLTQEEIAHATEAVEAEDIAADILQRLDENALQINPLSEFAEIPEEDLHTFASEAAKVFYKVYDSDSGTYWDNVDRAIEYRLSEPEVLARLTRNALRKEQEVPQSTAPSERKGTHEQKQ